MRTFLLFLLTVLAARADVTLSPLFSDGAVLQHGKPLPVWGTAEPGERVLVTWGEHQIFATTGQDGRWVVVLPALPPSSTPADLVVVGKNAIKVSDVLVGEVWICTGQASVALPASQLQLQANDAEFAGAAAGRVRQFSVPVNIATTPVSQLDGKWTVASAETATELSALGFLFARDLQPRLNVPIGIVRCAALETRIESWMSPAALTSDLLLSRASDAWLTSVVEYPRLLAEYQAAQQSWTQEAAAAKARNTKFNKPAPTAPWGPGHPATPSGVYHGMVNPLTPLAARGVLWSPGIGTVSYPDEYALAFKTLIESWRRHFAQPDLVFFWAQLPSFRAVDPAGTEWALLRDAQTQALALSDTGQVITVDLVETPEAAEKNVRELARRFALLARAQVYGMQLDFSGPVFVAATREGRAARVKLKHAGSALIARDKPLQSFHLAGPDGKFWAAVAKIERETLVVMAPEVGEPTAVRYAWSNAPEANLFNGAGLPAAPFLGRVE